jgi:hypothetical protein
MLWYLMQSLDLGQDRRSLALWANGAEDRRQRKGD